MSVTTGNMINSTATEATEQIAECNGLEDILDQVVSSEKQMSTQVTATVASIDKAENVPEEYDALPAMVESQLRFRVSRFINSVLMKLWRRRRSEVVEMHALANKYKEQAVKAQQELRAQRRIVCSEQRQGEELAKKLMSSAKRVKATSSDCAAIEDEVRKLRVLKSELNVQLVNKREECEQLEELLQSSNTELFREMGRLQETSKELANHQRSVRLLESTNAELEDELLNMKDRFQAQNDQMTWLLARKQGQLDTAYELLKGYEETYAALERQLVEVVRAKDDLEMRHQRQLEIQSAQARGLFYRMFMRLWRQLPNKTFQSCSHEICAGAVHSLIPVSTPPTLAHSYILCWAIAFLVATIR